MTINSASNTNLFLTRTIQSKQAQNISTSSDISSSSGNTSGDSVEISDEAYALYNASKSQGTPPPPPPQQQSDYSSSTDLSKILDSLVNDGTISSEQEAAITNVLTPSSSSDETAADYSDSDNPLKDALDSLVNEGTITSDQLSSIVSALVPPDKPVENEEAASSDRQGALEDILTSLKDDGTITSDQLSAVLSAIMPSKT